MHRILLRMRTPPLASDEPKRRTTLTAVRSPRMTDSPTRHTNPTLGPDPDVPNRIRLLSATPTIIQVIDVETGVASLGHHAIGAILPMNPILRSGPLHQASPWPTVRLNRPPPVVGRVTRVTMLEKPPPCLPSQQRRSSGNQRTSPCLLTETSNPSQTRHCMPKRRSRRRNG